ncbi:MAG: hypothetical protein KTR13_03840 [Saprospiraceae bacterium]|nr:hypothetical protein [Saprospiraceae bacterium]
MNRFEEATDPQYTSLYSDVDQFRDLFYSLSLEILNNEVSKYPIFVAYQDPVQLGKVLLQRKTHNTNWNINITILEDLVNKGIVQPEKLEEFKKVYKDPEQHFCILAIGLRKSEFIFTPRSKHNLTDEQQN